jgi:hypothetical protein
VPGSAGATGRRNRLRVTSPELREIAASLAFSYFSPAWLLTTAFEGGSRFERAVDGQNYLGVLIARLP